MGKYINKNSKSEHIGTSYVEKIENLVLDGAEIISPPKKWIENLVCVVNNGMFAAAAYAYSEGEMNEFKREDGRHKTWLIYPHVQELAL